MTIPSQPPVSNVDPIAEFLGQVSLAPRQAYKSLSLWPLVRREGAPPPAGPAYEPIGVALARGDVSVDEVDDGGSVPHVRVSNRSDKAVLFLFGEEIIGAKQNRVANATFLVPSRANVVIDVSCVESGRWSRRQGARFLRSEQVVSSFMRRKMAKQVTMARAVGDGFRADQASVWDDVKRRLRSSGTRSRTSAWSDYRAHHASDLGECERAFEPVAGQVGFVAAIGDAVAGLEAIGRPEVFAASFGALLRSYAIDALDAESARAAAAKEPATPRFDAPERFLAVLGGAERAWNSSLGLGSDLRLEGAGLEACALACEGLVHLTAFPASE
ncbi:MAG: hypothetical protein QNK04_19770 [Myxococcota bacterium]|nr:hypothetical protein [Myxococcota bacterium]